MENAYLQDLIYDLVAQSCGEHNDSRMVDSMALSVYAKAIRYLASIGKAEIQQQSNRRVIALLK